MEAFLAGLSVSLGAFLPSLLAAIVILIVGWLIAATVSSLVRRLLQRTSLDERLARLLSGSQSPRPEQVRLDRWISAAVFWLILFITIVLFLQTLNLTAISGPLAVLLTQILEFIPRLLSALVLLAIAWVLASILRLVVTRLLSASGFFRRLSEDAEVPQQNRVSLNQTLGNIVYWLVFLFFLPAILGALELQGILAPVQRIVDEILGVLPNVLGAALIFFVGWLVARVVRQIVTNLLAGIGADRLTEQAGMSGPAGQIRISSIVGTIVYVLILIPVAIAALNALNIPAVSGPASNLLNTLLNALPALFGAFLLLVIAYFVARILSRFVATILASLGFDRLFESIGLFRSSGAAARASAQVNAAVETGTAPGAARSMLSSPSDIVGYIVMVAILLFAAMETADLLGFQTLTALISRFIVAGTQVLVGLLIFGIGLYLSSLAERIIRNSGAAQAGILAPAARVAILVFSGALALREMGIAESIVNLAFGLLLGAVAVAAALAFGLGGREAASRQLERWQAELRAREALPPPRPDVTPPSPPPVPGD